MPQPWSKIEEAASQLAEFGRVRLDGKVAYLATVQDNGWPRIHPVTPVIGGGMCFIFADPESSKTKDLKSNGRFALHCGMTDSSGSSGEFKVTGSAREVTDEHVRQVAESVCSFRPSSRYLLFELMPAEVVSTTWRGGRPDRRRWMSD